MDNRVRNFSAMNPGHLGKCRRSAVVSHNMLSQINILHCQWKELKHKGGQRRYIAAAVGKKARLRTK